MWTKKGSHLLLPVDRKSSDLWHYILGVTKILQILHLHKLTYQVKGIEWCFNDLENQSKVPLTKVDFYGADFTNTQKEVSRI